MKTSNPAFSKDTYTIDIHAGAKMTFSGVMQKTGILLLLVVLSGSYVWNLFTEGANVMGWLWGGLIAGLILAFITIFNKTIAMYTAPLYAVAEGLVLGAISAMMQSVYPGIVFQAVLADPVQPHLHLVHPAGKDPVELVHVQVDAVGPQAFHPAASGAVEMGMGRMAARAVPEGAIPAALMALAAQGLFDLLERRLAPDHQAEQ